MEKNVIQFLKVNKKEVVILIIGVGFIILGTKSITHAIKSIIAKKELWMPVVSACSNTINTISNPINSYIQEKKWAGLTIDELNDIAKNTPRGKGVEIIGNTLDYSYYSQSGKKVNHAFFKQNPDGTINDIVHCTYPSSNSPRFFSDNLDARLR